MDSLVALQRPKMLPAGVCFDRHQFQSRLVRVQVGGSGSGERGSGESRGHVLIDAAFRNVRWKSGS